ncbi:MAG: non-canonical purine NTP pyrophosphatase [Patescibacteria group bacterium]
MKPPLLTIVTGNSLKFEEMSLGLSSYFSCIQGTLSDYQEIQGTPEDILRHKLAASYESFKGPVLAEDTSFHIDSLKGFPGPYIKDFTIALTIAGIGKRFVGESGRIVSWMGLAYSKDDMILVQGGVDGIITEAVKLDANDPLNFDSIFIASGHEKTFIEMTKEEKNTCSHRGNAMRALMNELKTKNI